MGGGGGGGDGRGRDKGGVKVVIGVRVGMEGMGEG